MLCRRVGIVAPRALRGPRVGVVGPPARGACHGGGGASGTHKPRTVRVPPRRTGAANGSIGLYLFVPPLEHQCMSRTMIDPSKEECGGSYAASYIGHSQRRANIGR